MSKNTIYNALLMLYRPDCIATKAIWNKMIDIMLSLRKIKMRIVPEIQLEKQHFLKQKQKTTQENNKNF